MAWSRPLEPEAKMKTVPVLLLVFLCAGMAQAQTMYRWVDQDGKVHYGDRPPPPNAASEVQQKKYAAPTADKPMSHALREAAKNFPVTLYVSDDCKAACDEARAYLAKRGVPHAEKRVSSNEEIDALRKLLGGEEAMVPSLQVGQKSSKGFLGPLWGELLDAAGYPGTP
jgi:hypothetical protein